MGKGLEDLRMLKDAEFVADGIWRQVGNWQAFDRNTVGEQLVRAADSIGANLAEAYGRFHYGEKLRFLYYARGSLFETKYWLNRTSSRNLLPIEDIDDYAKQLSGLARQINTFANSIKQQRKTNSNTASLTIKETEADYQTNPNGTNIFNDDELIWIESISSNL